MSEIKYKPCCDYSCLLGRCETREVGGCYCVCRLVDHISNLESVIKGHVVAEGCVYIPDPENRNAYMAKLSPERHAKEIEYRDVVAPKLLKEARERLKKYEIANGNS